MRQRATTIRAAAAAGAVLVAALVVLALPSSAAAASPLDIGVGRADITPPTGYYMMGWVRSDGVIQGQHTRLWARVIVLREGGRKIALATEDLNGIPGGMMAAAANLDRDIGFSQENVLDSASHTHAAPTSFYNFSTYNSVFMTLRSPTDFNLTGSLDQQLYAFMVQRLALAIRRANANLGPGELGWARTQVDNITENRSIEAHLYDHGIHLPYGSGSAALDPNGPLHTIDPDANVLRVDKLIGGRRVPVGMWSTFANHGTVNKFQFTYYNEDHHGAATHRVESAIRSAGHVPAGQDVVNAYGNTDEGDISSGLHRSGPAAAEYVGQIEAAAFLNAWQQAGRHMQRAPTLDWRWTRMCWCGQETPDGPVADHGAFGLSEFTGSEEGRGPLFDITRVPFEGDHLPVGGGPDLPVGLSQNLPEGGPQGDKIVTPIPLTVPKAVPLMALRISDRMVVSVPGEMTEEMGRRVRAAVVQATAGSGIAAAVVSGLANEYADYFTTPQEYDAQHYEGGATVYGRASSDALEQVLVQLSANLVAGKPAPAPYPYDPQNGVSPDGAPFSSGAASAGLISQPGASAVQLGHPTFWWRGGVRGYDRPLDRPFVLIERQVAVRAARSRRRGSKRTGRRRHRHARSPVFTASAGIAAAARRSRPGRTVTRFQQVDSDLGLNVLWTVDSNGAYRAEWEVPLGTPPGNYRFVIEANNYTLSSTPFRVGPSAALTATRVAAPPGRVAVELAYPQPAVHEGVGEPPGDAGADLTARPSTASSGHARVLVNGRAQDVTAGPSGLFEVAAAPGAQVEVAAGAAADSYGNRNANELSFGA